MAKNELFVSEKSISNFGALYLHTKAQKSIAQFQVKVDRYQGRGVS